MKTSSWCPRISLFLSLEPQNLADLPFLALNRSEPKSSYFIWPRFGTRSSSFIIIVFTFVLQKHVKPDEEKKINEKCAYLVVNPPDFLEMSIVWLKRTVFWRTSNANEKRDTCVLAILDAFVENPTKPLRSRILFPTFSLDKVAKHNPKSAANHFQLE